MNERSQLETPNPKGEEIGVREWRANYLVGWVGEWWEWKVRVAPWENETLVLDNFGRFCWLVSLAIETERRRKNKGRGLWWNYLIIRGISGSSMSVPDLGVKIGFSTVQYWIMTCGSKISTFFFFFCFYDFWNHNIFLIS